MFSGNTRKFLITAALIFTFFSACRFWQKPETTAPGQISVTDERISDVPFSNKEPEVYQAEIVTGTYANGEKQEQKNFSVRNGLRRLTIFNFGGKEETELLESGDGRRFSINKSKKIYTENKLQDSLNPGEDFLTTEWLNSKTPATFENLGKENNLLKFRARLNESDKAEILIYIDENLQIPVKQEFYSVSGDQRLLTFSAEVKNFKLEADEKLFEMPKDFREVSAREFQDALRSEEPKNK